MREGRERGYLRSAGGHRGRPLERTCGNQWAVPHPSDYPTYLQQTPEIRRRRRRRRSREGERERGREGGREKETRYCT